MQNSLRALVPHFDTINIWWMITMRCNYACWYCASYDNTLPNDKFKSIETYKRSLDYLKSLWSSEEKIVVTLTGGEPLLFKQWPQLLYYEGIKINILTNLSVSLETLKNRLGQGENTNSIIVSYHPQFSNYNEILPKLLYLKEKGHLKVVKVLNDTHRPEVVSEAYKLFIENDLPVIFTYLDNQKEENRLIGSNISIKNSKKPNKIAKKLEIVYDSHSELVDSDYIYRNGLNKFEGMLCGLGQRNLYLDYMGNAYPSACLLNFRKARLGNVFNEDITLYTKPKTCPFTFCACGSDFEFPKWDKDYYEKTYQQTS